MHVQIQDNIHVQPDPQLSTEQTIEHSERKLNILVVEDNPVNQIVVTEMLKLCNAAPAVANHGEEALALINQEKFDLILMDCQMPVMDGFETTRIIRERESKQQSIEQAPTKIIALTANAFEADKMECRKAGMDDHLAKPLQIEALQAMLQKHFPGF